MVSDDCCSKFATILYFFCVVYKDLLQLDGVELGRDTRKLSRFMGDGK